MGNTLTNLYPTIYQALDQVAREMLGYIPAVVRNTDVERAAVGENIGWPVVTPGTVGDITPAATGPAPNDMTAVAVMATISKSRGYTFYLTGDELKGLRNGSTDQIIVQNQFQEAFRALCNEIEVDLHAVAYKAASRIVGASGTALFNTASDFSDFANAKKILKDNGAPTTNLKMVLSTTAMATLLSKQAILFKANEAGSDEGLRNGRVGRIEGFDVGESAAPQIVTKGTGASYVINGSHAIGSTSIVLKTGTGTILEGDSIAFQNDANIYNVITGIAAPGTIVIQEPGLRIAHVDSETATLSNNFTPSTAFDSAALFLAARAPAVPEAGDSAVDVMTVVDPVSGLPFDIRVYLQYHRVAYEVGMAWGVKAVKGRFIAKMIA
jgi:hypothetical protein